MKKSFLSLLAITLLAACSAAPKRARSHGDGPGAGTGTGDAADGSGTDAGTSQEGALPSVAYSPSPGSAMRLLDGNALTVLYARVFPPRSYGYEICRGDEIKKFRNFADCTNSIFTMGERPFVGTIALNTPDLNRGTQNLRLPEDLTLNYMRTLRAGLSRECEARVALEYQNLMEGKQAENLLIKAERPSKESVDAFYLRILGAEGSGISVSYGVEAYLAAFDQVTGGKSDPASIKLAYNGLCIAVAMDPHFLIY